MERRSRDFALIALAILGGIFLLVELMGSDETEESSAPLPSRRLGTWELATDSQNTSSFAREIHHPLSERVRLERTPQHVVSQTVASDEILIALGAQEQVRALSKFSIDARYSKIVEEARSLEVLEALGAESVLRLKPDLVLAASFNTQETVGQIRRAGVPVVQFFEFDSLESIAHNIAVIGFCLGRETQADALIAEMNQRLEAIRARVPTRDSTPLRVLSYGSGCAPGQGTIFDDIIGWIGAINVPAQEGLDGFPRISQEQIATWDPDIILIGDTEEHVLELRSTLLKLEAITKTRDGQQRRFGLVPNAQLLCASHHIVDLVDTLVRILYKGETETAETLQ